MAAEAKNLNVVRNGEAVTLTWEATTTSYLIGFLIEQSVEGGSWTKLSPVAATTTSVTLAQPKACKYRVWCQDKVGVSNTVEVPAAVSPVVLDPPVLSVTGRTLSWAPLPGQTSYVVAVVANPTGVRTTAYFSTTSTSFTLTPVPGATMNYGCAGAAVGSKWAKEVTVVWPATEPAPFPEPPVPSPKLVIGLQAGGWGLATELSDLKGVVPILRVENAPDQVVSEYGSGGFKLIDLYNHPTTGGTGALNPEADATVLIARATAHSNTAALELQNEPQNPYMGWGSGSESQANIEAYAHYINVIVDRFNTAFGVGNGPALLWSADGGFKGIPTWGLPVFERLSAAAKARACPTVHPYGGVNNRAQSALGNRGRVEEAHALTHRPVWVTEIGWPTDVGGPNTGDSFQWTQQEQANNIFDFAHWAASLGYVQCVSFFGYRDYGSNDFYGIETHVGEHKLAYATVRQLAVEL